MRKVIFAINISADGFCGHESMFADEELHAFFAEVIRNAGVLLYGRVTFELMVPFWPNAARDQQMPKDMVEFGRVFDAVEKVVFSRTLKRVDDAHSRLARADLFEEVRSLKMQAGKDIVVGSLSIASQLSERGLIDEYTFVVHPVVAGRGPRLFDSVNMNEGIVLDLLDSERFKSGVVALKYMKRL